MNPKSKVVGLDELPGKSNYFIGNDPKKWRTNVPSYRKVKCENVYPGIDLVYYGNQRQVEYDFVVAPGANPQAIALQIETTTTKLENRNPKIDANGDLVISSDAGEVRFHKPVVYQSPAPSPQPRQLVDGRFVLLASNRIGFKVGDYDRSKPLVIDPTLSYSTYLGGSDHDEPNGIAVDSAGNAYVVGTTWSQDFPTAGPSTAPHARNDVFVTKVNAAGSALVCSCYLGGGSYDYGWGITLDATGNIYVTGSTQSSDFPITPSGVIKETLSGISAFVTKIDSSCFALAYSTFLGGSEPNGYGYDDGRSIAVDSSGNAYVIGRTSSWDFPSTPGAYDTTCGTDGQCNGGHPDLFVAKLDATASSLLYATYLGGSADEFPWGRTLAVDSFGNIYVVGLTTSADFPTTSGAFDTTCNDGGICDWNAPDGFFAKIDPAQAGGDSLVYSTYIGGSAGEYSTGVAVDSSGIAYVAGFTGSADFPTTPNAFQRTYGGKNCGTVSWCADATVMKIDPAQDGAASLLYSTYLGGSKDEGALGGVVLDAAGNIYVTGRTFSSDFPLASPTQATYGGGTCNSANWGGSYPCFDIFVTKLNPSGSALIFSTYLGGDKSEEVVSGIAVDPSGNVYVVGTPGPTGFPTTSAAFQTSSIDTCADFPAGYIAFVQWYGYGPGMQWDANGNALILGQMTTESYNTFKALPLPSSLDQKYCDAVAAAPQDSYPYYYSAALYVPTAAERNGDFSWFQGQIYDPVTGDPLPGNVIPPERIPDLMGWRVSTTGRGGGDAFVAKFSPADNTPAGSNVAVPLTSKVSATYDSVSSSGTTAVTQTSSGPTPPSGFSLGVPPTYYDLSTTATFSGLIRVCVSYAGTTFVDETSLKLLHFEGGAWIDRTVSLNTATKIICASVTSLSRFGVFEPTLAAHIQPPIEADGSSVFTAKRGVVPIKFTLTLRGSETCALPPATISLLRMAGDVPTVVNESEYLMPSDNGSNFRISDCQYVYNLATSSLGAGTYRVDIRIGTAAVGSATFGLK